MGQETQALKNKLKKYTKEQNINLNPNEKFVDAIITGLLKNKEDKGEIYCPCRVVTGNKEEDKKIICPCIYHKQEIKSMGHCHCNLFVK